MEYLLAIFLIKYLLLILSSLQNTEWLHRRSKFKDLYYQAGKKPLVINNIIWLQSYSNIYYCYCALHFEKLLFSTLEMGQVRFCFVLFLCFFLCAEGHVTVAWRKQRKTFLKLWFMKKKTPRASKGTFKSLFVPTNYRRLCSGKNTFIMFALSFPTYCPLRIERRFALRSKSQTVLAFHLVG